MARRLIALLAAALAVVLAVAGCGGSDSSTASITRAEFIKKADAACRKGEEEIQKEFAVYIKGHEDVTSPTEDDYSELVETIFVPSAEQEMDEIRALGIPRGDEDQVEALLDARERSIEAAKDEPKALISNSKKIFGEASKLANDYGLKDCGNR